MPDNRDLREKLEAMANQTESPHEAQIARAKLLAMGEGARLPPRRPPSAPAPGFWSFSSGTSANVTFNGMDLGTQSYTVYIRREPSR